MGVAREFREFAMRGNVLDMAVGIIIGGAFGKIISSLVSDILLPPLGLVMGKLDFSSFFINLSGRPLESLAAAKAAGAPTINIGVFLNTLVDFLLVALAVFLLIREVNRIKRLGEKGQPAPVPTTRECPFCLSTVPLRATRCPHCTSDLPPG